MTSQYPDIAYIGPPASYGSTSYPKRYVAIHNTSNDASAEGEAGYAMRRTDGVSSHYYVDGDSIVQSLHTDLGANHAGSSTGNRYAISYEITGVNGWTRQQWLDRVAWPLLARQIARDCRRHGIAVQLLTVAQMRDGRTTGVVTHDLMRQAWGGTTHTDPGPGFPLDHLLALVRAEMTGLAVSTTQEDDMIGFATDTATGQLRKSIGGITYPTTQREIDDIRSLGKQGIIGPVSDKTHPNLAYAQSFGLPVETLIDRIAKRVIELLPPGQGGTVPTAQEIAVAVADEGHRRSAA